MEQLLSSPVQIAKPHALPFRVIFEEHRRRRRQDLLRNAATFLLPTDAEPLEEFAEQALIAHIHRQEQAYEKLAEANAAIEAGDFSTPTNITKDDPGLSAYAPTPPDVDSLLKECEKADEPLKQILHSMEASALCLSGGGIRSASFSLGVLEGLSRFSRSRRFDSRDGLMDRFDYLSTVSGGGYIGSWMMSWVYRRMSIVPTFASFDVTFKSIENCQNQCLAAQAAISAPGIDATAIGLPWARLIRSCERALNHATSARETARRSLTPAKSASSRLESATAAVESLDRVVQGLKSAKSLTASSLQRAVANALRPVQRLFGKEPDAQQDSEDPARVLAETAKALAQAFNILEESFHRDWVSAYSEVISALAGNSGEKSRRPDGATVGKPSVTGGDPEPQAVRHLRSYTSFLAPALGLTLDTFTLAAIVLRNLVVNWAMLLPVLIFAVAVPQASRFLFLVANSRLSSHSGFDLAALIAFLFLVAAIAAAVGLPSHHAMSDSLPWIKPFRRQSVKIFLGATLAGAWLLAASWNPQGQIVHWSDFLWVPIVRLLRYLLPADFRMALGTAPIAFLGFLCFGLIDLSGV